MSRVAIVSAVFSQVTSLATELNKMYPDDPDFPIFLSAIHLLKISNPNLLINMTRNTVKDFIPQIEARDESFFLKYEVDANQIADTGVNMDLFPKLKFYYGKMSDQTKNTVWQYIQNITKLIQAC